jgi:alpha-D-ribose 1-methylphosphonate 5-triphosphate synthase subunit PhnI
MDLTRYKSVNIPKHLYEKLRTLAKNTQPPQTITKTWEIIFDHYEETAMSAADVKELHRRTDEYRESIDSPYVGWERHIKLSSYQENAN